MANKFIFWTPRILAILFILFLALFSLDIFDGNYGFWGTILGLFIHNIPSLILLVILMMSWRHELVGAIIFGLLGIVGIVGTIGSMLTIPVWYMFNPIFIILGVICTSVGVLFYLGWKQKKATNLNKKTKSMRQK